MQPNLGHPGDDAGVGYPGVEVLELVQVFVPANSIEPQLTNESFISRQRQHFLTLLTRS